MRDMQERKFAGCCRYIGFNPVPKGKSPHLEFVSDDGALRVPATADKAAIEQAAIACEAFQKFAPGATPKKVVVVPGRLVNLVL